MNRLRTLLIPLLLCSSLAVAEPVTKANRGAILCAYLILVASKTVEKVCSLDQNDEFAAVLTDSIASLEKVLLENSEVSQSEIEEVKNMILSQFEQAISSLGESGTEEFCRDDLVDSPAALYRTLKSRGLEAMRSEISQLLTVPREPVKTCL